MVCLLRLTLPLVLFASLALSTPVGGLGNHAHIVVEAPASAAATCQLFVLVNSLIILEMESGLGLVTAAGRPFDASLLPAPTHTGSTASCEAVIDTLRIVVPSGTPLATSSFVSGPPAMAVPSTHIVAPGSDAVACRLAFIHDSVIIGGAPFGFPPGEVHGLIELTTPSSQGGQASCLTRIGELVVDKTGGASS